MSFWRDLAQSGGTPELEETISDILWNIGVRWDGSIHSLVALYGMLGDFSRQSDDRMVISMNQGIQDLYNKESRKSSMNFEDIEGEALRSRARDRAAEEAFLYNRRRATSTERRTLESLVSRAAGNIPVPDVPNVPNVNVPLRNPRLRWTIIVALTFLLPVMFNRLPSSNNNTYTPTPTPFSREAPLSSRARSEAGREEQRQQAREQEEFIRPERDARQQAREQEEFIRHERDAEAEAEAREQEEFIRRAEAEAEAREREADDLARQQLRDDAARFKSPMKHLSSLIPAVPTKSELDSAFHLLTLIHHPDKPGGDAAMFMKLMNARKDIAIKFNLKRRPN